MQTTQLQPAMFTQREMDVINLCSRACKLRYTAKELASHFSTRERDRTNPVMGDTVALLRGRVAQLYSWLVQQSEAVLDDARLNFVQSEQSEVKL